MCLEWIEVRKHTFLYLLHSRMTWDWIHRVQAYSEHHVYPSHVMWEYSYGVR